MPTAPTVTRKKSRQPRGTTKRRSWTRTALAKLMPAFDWDAFLRGAQIPSEKVPAVNVTQPSYFEALGKLFAEVPVADWRVYYRYKLLSTYASDLPAKFEKLKCLRRVGRPESLPTHCGGTVGIPQIAKSPESHGV